MLDFNRFEILTFDCYGTLINWEDGILGCLHRILSSHGKALDAATILELYSHFEAQAEQGEYRRYRDVLQAVVKCFGERLGFPVTDAEANSLPESLPDWKPWPDTVEALRHLRSRFKLANHFQRRRRSFRRNSAEARGAVPRHHYRATGERIQTFAENIRAGAKPHQCSNPPDTARRTKRLS